MSMMPVTAQFTTRARVVDLLGREQIADAPTAMGELFKNAIDAAATKVRIDFWQKKKCLVVSDNGLGMRADEDLVGKWLVLATESKQPGKSAPTDWMRYANSNQKMRLSGGKTFGQKGIGRLAIALLGTGTLVWTRWGSGAEFQRTLLLVPWSVFRHPKLTLDQIELPMLRLDRPATHEDALSLVKTCQEWVSKNKLLEAPEFGHLPLLHRDLENEFRHSLSAPIEFPDTPGTSFVVLNTDDVVANHFEGWLGKDDLFGEDDSFSPEGPKAYLAFNNPFAQESPRLELELWADGRLAKGNSRNFWSRSDFGIVDHHVRVKIDQDGFARGIVRRLDEEIVFEQQLKRLPERAACPGVLEVEVGYIEGDQKTSRLAPDEWVTYNKRALHFGGFYVYVDDVRVCPYGRDDSDFIGFEKRRSFSAGRHFWSHRRMFGGVFLHRDLNPDLSEKAGREGFQQNAAYRGLVHYLQSLFIELADSYFGSKAKRPDKEKKKEEKERAERELRQARERSAFFERFELSKRAIEAVFTGFERESLTVEQRIKDLEEGIAALLLDPCRDCLQALRRRYQGLWNGMVTLIPNSFSLNAEEAEAVDRYLYRKTEIDSLAQQRLKQLAGRFDQVVQKHEAVAQRQNRGRDALEAARSAFAADVREASDKVAKAKDFLGAKIATRPQHDLELIDALAKHLLTDEEALASVEQVEEVIAKQSRMVQEETVPYYLMLESQIKALAESDGGLIEAADLREELRVLKEREQHLFELAQLGLVMESADHDYRSMLEDEDNAIAELQSVIPAGNKQALQNLKDALLHIDEQLQAFDPLVRRVRGRVSELTGEDIRAFVQSAFDKSRRPNVSFEYTPKFLEAVFSQVKRPVFLGAVHNLVRNAGYWATRPRKEGRIRFSLAGNGFVISDSGAGVHERDRDRIFEPHFSRRPSGRGLGLFIARSCLQAFGYQVELLTTPASGALPGANFLISRPQKFHNDLD